LGSSARRRWPLGHVRVGNGEMWDVGADGGNAERRVDTTIIVVPLFVYAPP
jgi:hypothetical protein